MRFDRYIFVCIREREPDHRRGSCAVNGSLEVVDALKAAVKAHRLQLEVRVNKSMCLECCELGPTVMVHPDNVWYQKVTPEDAKAIVEEHIIGGNPVERLKMDFSYYGK